MQETGQEHFYNSRIVIIFYESHLNMEYGNRAAANYSINLGYSIRAVFIQVFLLKLSFSVLFTEQDILI